MKYRIVIQTEDGRQIACSDLLTIAEMREGLGRPGTPMEHRNLDLLEALDVSERLSLEDRAEIIGKLAEQGRARVEVAAHTHHLRAVQRETAERCMEIAEIVGDEIDAAAVRVIQGAIRRQYGLKADDAT